jgi:hypothetical protein
MARPLSCPVCRVDLPPGGTHCPRCGLRIAALPRRPRHRDLTDADAATVAAVEAGGVPLSLPQALARGALGGAGLVLVCAVIAFAVTRDGFAAGMSNAAFFAGGITVTVALLLGGLRVRRLVGDLETMRRRALGGGEKLAHDHVRLAIATSGVLALAVAALLAAVAH